MSRHPYEYGEEEVCKITLETLTQKARLSDIDMEILYLRFGADWLLEDIAKYIGKKYYNRTDENPLWERAIRYRLEKAIRLLREIGKELDFHIEE